MLTPSCGFISRDSFIVSHSSFTNLFYSGIKMSSNFLGSTGNLNRPSSGVELLLKEKNKEATCKYIAGNDGKIWHINYK
jgi:hypothetical protein